MEQQKITRYFSQEDNKTEWSKMDNIKEEINLDWDEKDNFSELPTARVLIERLDSKTLNNILDKKTKENRETTLVNNKSKSPTGRVSKRPSNSKIKTDTVVKKRKVNVEIPEETKDCPKCKKPYKIQTYDWHVHYCGKERTLQCPHCPYKTKYNKCLVAHLSRIHPKGGDASASKMPNGFGIRKYCEKCDKAFEAIIIGSCEVCSSKLLYQCSVCNKNMSKRGPAYYHWVSKCGVRGYYHCYLCDYKAVFRSGVVDHLKKVHPKSQSNETIKWESLVEDGDSSNKCPKCDKHLSNFRTPKMHVRFCKGVKNNVISNTDVSGPTPCLTCGKEFEHMHALNRHMKTCKRNRCVIRRAKDSDDEIIDVVGDDPPVPLISANKIQKDINQLAVKYCVKCKAESEIEQTLYKYGPKQNMQCSKCKTTLMLKCKKCRKEYVSKRNIVSHLRFGCYIEDEFKCIECNFQAVSLQRVRDHYEVVHEILSSECKKCGKKFKNPKLLQAHSRHCGLEPKFQCDHCPFKSKLKMNLKHHIFRRHMKLKVVVGVNKSR